MSFLKQEECGCCHSVMTEKESEEVIDFLTDLGMLPPTSKLSKIKANDNAWESEE